MNSKPETCMSTRMLPSANMAMAVRTIRPGELVNSGLTQPRSTEVSQNARNTSIEIVPSRACSCRAQNDVGGGRMLSSRAGRAAACSTAPCMLAGAGAGGSSAWARSRLVMDAPLSCHRQHAGLLRFLLDQPPDALYDLQERRLKLDQEGAFRRQVDGDDLLDAGGTRREHDHPIGEKHRLVDLMGDEQRGRFCAGENFQQLDLHEFAGLGI